MKDKEIYQVIAELFEEYDKAKEKAWIYNPVGYALYQVWQRHRDVSED